MQKVIKIGLLGAGTVGSGVVKVLEMNRQQITERVGAELMIKKVLVRDCSKVRPFLANYQVTDKIEDILNDDEIEILEAGKRDAEGDRVADRPVHQIDAGIAERPGMPDRVIGALFQLRHVDRGGKTDRRILVEY